MNTTTRPTRTAPSPAQQGAVQELQLQTHNQGQTIAQNQPNLLVPQIQAVMKKIYPAKIAKAILAVTRNANPVAKAGWNDFHKYAYRKWEDVFEELVPLICEHGLIIQQSEIAHGGFAGDLIEISYEFTIINEDGDVWPDRPSITAICKVRDAKGILDDKAASKANTQAQKYFYTSFFKIRSVDVSETDHDAGGDGRPKRRAVPDPSGAVSPHFVEIIGGEHPSEWAKRFTAKLAHAKKPEDIDEWYAKNEAVFVKLAAKPEYQEVYDGLVEAMDKRTIEIAPNPKDEKRQQGDDGGFPGDKAMPDIPENLRRTAPLPVSDRDKEWLRSLEEAFQQCTTTEELAAEQDSMMMPAKDTVPVHVWEAAVSITKRELERIQRA